MSAQGPPTPPIWLLPEPPERRWGLGRAEIVRAAVALADAGGADALTMRAVATALGSSTPMSLYRYVHSKDGLVDLMLDAAGAEIPTPEHAGDDWRGELTRVALDSWAMMKRHLWFAQLVHTRPPAGPESNRRQEFMLASFDRQGQELPAALGYQRLLDGYIVGQALQRAEEQKMLQRNAFGSVEDVQRLAREWFGDGEGDVGPYPLLGRYMRGFLSEGADGPAPPDEDAQFTLGLECLLDGIAARLR